jgi:hypothetical protein
MGIPEPASPLWAAVKAIHDSWPPDDEGVARAVGGAWRRGGDVLGRGADESARAGEDVRTAWRDAAGQAFDGRLGAFRTTVGRSRQRTLMLAAQGENYAAELESAKTAITATIAVNEKNFALLSDPRFGVLGLTYRKAFATAVANYLQNMIAQKAAALRAHPTAPGPFPPEPPKLPLPADGVDDLVADGVRTLGDADQLLWLGAGEVSDDIFDDAGAQAGEVLRTLGNLTGNGDLVQQGDDLQLAGDVLGDEARQEALGYGADDQADLYHAAESIDGDKEPTKIYISSEQYPESAGHIDAAQGGKSYRGGPETEYDKEQPTELTIDREEAGDRRNKSMRSIPDPPAGQDRDEYPPAVFQEGGEGASVKNILRSDNRGAGAKIGHQLNHYPLVLDSYARQSRKLQDGDTVVIETY